MLTNFNASWSNIFKLVHEIFVSVIKSISKIKIINLKRKTCDFFALNLFFSNQFIKTLWFFSTQDLKTKLIGINYKIQKLRTGNIFKTTC